MNNMPNFVRLINSACKNQQIFNQVTRRNCSLPKPQKNEEQNILSSKPISEEIDFVNDIKAMKAAEKDAILKPLSEDISHIAPYFQPTFNFAAYVNKSQTLQKLVDLGVKLHKIEKKKDIPEYIMKLDFEKDIKQHIFFLHDLGVLTEQLGNFITINPSIFKEDLETLRIRVNYLQSKKFTEENIARIVTENPHWLMFSTKRIDNRLGYFQRTFNLTGKEVRLLAVKKPKLITYNFDHINLNTFSIKEEMGFSNEDMKTLLLEEPKLLMMSQNSIRSRFEYIHNTMKIPHEQILKTPRIFRCRKFRIEQRHKFLLKLNRAQFDPKKENYVSLEELIAGSDREFCVNVVKCSVQAFNTFLKSL